MTISTSTPKASGGAEDFDDAATCGAAGLEGEVGDLDVDGEAFEGLAEFGVAPIGYGEGDFFAEDAVGGGVPERRRREFEGYRG